MERSNIDPTSDIGNERSGILGRLGLLPHEGELPEQGCKAKWFLQEDRIRGELGLLKVLGITRHIYYPNGGMELDDLTRKLRAAEARHNDVGEENVDLARMPAGHFQSLRGGFRFENRITSSPQNLHDSA